jgi:hypothetical protein
MSTKVKFIAMCCGGGEDPQYIPLQSLGTELDEALALMLHGVKSTQDPEVKALAARARDPDQWDELMWRYNSGDYTVGVVQVDLADVYTNKPGREPITMQQVRNKLHTMGQHWWWDGYDEGYRAAVATRYRTLAVQSGGFMLGLCFGALLGGGLGAAIFFGAQP